MSVSLCSLPLAGHHHVAAVHRHRAVPTHPSSCVLKRRRRRRLLLANSAQQDGEQQQQEQEPGGRKEDKGKEQQPEQTRFGRLLGEERSVRTDGRSRGYEADQEIISLTKQMDKRRDGDKQDERWQRKLLMAFTGLVKNYKLPAPMRIVLNSSVFRLLMFWLAYYLYVTLIEHKDFWPHFDNGD
ncbi:unnamed protein product [Vitrella brassicaformis CCMP3155]|uniref:Uncharacterized protein n=1 Tax=Vitrella brassicaformis (strain CCMP3155) TaxID=1169540 RepID=A0A0G4FTP0_VITBC|nr:unnamed protein product [Vitrella brassicaformis CCMP3155]|eukprot:CEM18258.1 unnamed protein product [Vitrella brassicaformis CCMP3155]